MMIASKGTVCDFTDRKYDSPVEGIGFIARGETGRHCVVMWCGPEYAAEKGYVPIPYNEAVAKAELNGWADF